VGDNRQAAGPVPRRAREMSVMFRAHDVVPGTRLDNRTCSAPASRNISFMFNTMNADGTRAFSLSPYRFQDMSR